MHESDDAAIWGLGAGRQDHWPRWLLFSAAVAGMAGMAGVGPAMRTSTVSDGGQEVHREFGRET
jgi:hypothetical protein